MIPPKEKSRAPKDSMTLLPCFYFVELPIVASSVVTLYFLELTDLFKPAKVGFQCHDRALSMPYVETNEELIPLLMLLSLAFAAPAASIMVGEGMVYCLQSRLKGRAGAEGSINAGGCNFNSFLRRTVRFVGVHVFGLCATALVTDVIQLATGYHAPFFLTVCKPNYTLLGTPCDANPYITQDICSGTDKHAILSARYVPGEPCAALPALLPRPNHVPSPCRKTFPSQHATLSAFAAVYVSMYFNSIISDSTKLLKPILVFAFAIAAGICGLTQITQYRSHPADVYVGFLIGSGIAAYLAFHAVGNFRAPTERVPTQAPAKDALRALTQRGHDSVYHQNKSVSTDELNPQARLEEAARPVPREKNSLGSLKRASVDVDLLAPRSPMGKENMVTFSNTLPRVNTPSMDDPARRHMTIHVPVDASRSKQLITEWKQKSLEGRSMTLAEEAAQGRGVGEPGEEVPPSLYPTWVMVAEKGGAQRVANPPRLMQVIAMSKQQSLVSVTPKHSETSSSSTSSDSSQYRSPSERDSSSIITIDAHAPHHPVVHLSAGNGPWEWKSGPKGPEGPDTYELGEVGKDFHGFRPAKSAGVSPGSSVSDMEQDEPRYGSLAAIPGAAGGGGERVEAPPEGLLATASRDSTLRRKPAERDGAADSEVDLYYKKMQAGRRFKD
ncbi:PLPR3 protein, partial [Chloropsis cyanopogon]|nr:PLPR3 protein [Chloropsis cyanopogon]